MRRLVFAVIDGCGPEQLRAAIDAGRAPVLARIARDGESHRSVAAFPSVTPVCATALATGVRQDRHRIPSMNWWDRSRGRYVEYGSSFAASRKLGIVRQLADTVYHLNGRHLAPEVETVFESLDDRGVRTAGTTFLVYRGRYRHQLAKGSAMNRVASTVFRKPVMGPRELFYADLFASRETGCSSQFGLPGIRDQHAGCVGAYLVERDLVDFLLLSLPDNDTHSHKHGPDAQIDSIAAADEQLARIATAAGGLDRFLEQWGVVVASDHAHALVERRGELRPAFEPFGIVRPGGPRKGDRIAYCPASRSASVYVLDRAQRADLLPELVAAGRDGDGVELVVWRDGDEGVIASGPEAAVAGELRFRPGGPVADTRGGTWEVRGTLDLVGAAIEGGVLRSDSHPDPLGRCWSALTCVNSGDVLLSAAKGVEFPDWGDVDHVDAGSHGSLRAEDSVGVLLAHGLDGRSRPGLPAREGATTWSIEDPVPLILEHFAAQADVRAPAAGSPSA